MADEDEIDKELGEPDPEATADEAMGTLDPATGAPAEPGAEPAAEPGAAALAPPQVQAPQVPPPPGLVPAGTHAVKGTQTVTALQPNADMAQGHAAEMKVFGDERKLAGDQAALQGKAAEIEQQRAEQVADETARQNAVIQAEQVYQQEQAQQRAAQFSRDIEHLRASKPPGGMSEWSGGKRTLASLSIALGGLAAGQNGTANFALADVNRKLDDEQKRYNAGIENQYKAMGLQQGLNHELDNQAKDALAQGQARKVLAIESLNKYADAQLKALGIPAAAQAGIKAQLGFDKQAADAQQKYGQLLASKVTDTTHFAPGKAGAGGGGGGGVVNLVKMAENGSKRSEIVAAAAKAGIPEKQWKNQVDLAFVEREKGEAAGEKAKAAKETADAETEVQDFYGNPIGNTATSRAGKTQAAEAKKRAGAANALVAQLDEAINHVEKEGHVAGVESVGVLQSEAYKERLRLLAGVQAKARAFSELPASEGGLHLEHAQIGSPNSASAKQLKAFRDDVIKQTDLKNRALLTSASRAKGEAAPKDQKSLAEEWESAKPIGKGSR